MTNDANALRGIFVAILLAGPLWVIILMACGLTVFLLTGGGM